jgi:alkylhydroperoxidase/carboxymuconolactone decarboxylase family protein YurZ
MNTAEALKQIREFEAHYKYDGTFMRELLEHSPVGLAKFNSFLPLSAHREKLSPEYYWVAKLATMQVEDCGECLQLNVRMALEAGVSKGLVRAAIQGGNELPENLKDVYLYAKSVANHELVENELMGRIEARYDKGSLLEFGLCIASAKVFPTIKRALGYTKACSLIEIEV